MRALNSHFLLFIYWFPRSLSWRDVWVPDNFRTLMLPISVIMVALWNRADHYVFMLWFVMVVLCNRADHYIFALLFLSSSIVFPRLISATQFGCLPCFDTWCGPRANLECRLKGAARGSLQMKDPKSHQKLPSGHHPTTLSGYIFSTKASIDNRKKTC